jgi:hypothetical protein
MPVGDGLGSGDSVGDKDGIGSDGLFEGEGDGRGESVGVFVGNRDLVGLAVGAEDGKSSESAINKLGTAEETAIEVSIAGCCGVSCKDGV